MRLASLSLTVVFLLSITWAQCGRSAQRHTNEAKGFSIEVPETWTVQDTALTPLVRFGVFLVARNAEAAGVTPFVGVRHYKPGRMKPWMDLLEEQVPEGGVVLYLYHFLGGPLPVCNFSADSVGDDVAAVVDTLAPGRTERGSWSFGVFKWNCDWHVLVLENRASQADHEAARKVVGSLEFVSKPVVRRGQAASLAYERLADIMVDGIESILDVEVEEEREAFLVTFEDCVGCQEDAPRPRKWVFRVSRTGVVEPVEMP